MMSIRIRIATSSLELDRLYRARHLAMGPVQPPVGGLSGSLRFDRYDTYPGTANIIAAREHQIMGGVRFSNHADTRHLQDEFPGMDLTLPPNARVGSIGMFFTAEPHREGTFLGQSMLGLGFQWALAQGLTHLYTVLNPTSRDLLEAGFKPLWTETGEGTDFKTGVLAVLDLRELDERFLRFSQRDGGHQLMFSLVRDYCESGDTIVSQGELGSSCYLIGNGKVAVEVKPPGGNQTIRVAELGPGQLFGELALLTSRPRSASVVAISDVELMVISRETFNNLVRTESAIAVHLLEILGERLATTVERLAAATVSSRNSLTDGSGSNAWLGGDGCSWG